MALKNKLLLDIEIPVANKQNVAYTHFIPSLKYLAPIKDYIRFLINFNGNTTTKDKIKICVALTKHGFNFNTITTHYEFEKGKADNLIIRKDTHNIVKNHAPYFLFFDDDIQITSKNYCKDLMASILFLEKNPTIGTISIANRIKRHDKYLNTIFYLNTTTSAIYTGGGIVFRNIPEWDNQLIPAHLSHLFGCNVDNLLGIVRLQYGLFAYCCETNNYNHFEHHVENGGKIISGINYYNWKDTFNHKDSIFQYLLPLKADKEYATGFLKPNIFTNLPSSKPNLFNYKNKTLEEIIGEVI